MLTVVPARRLMSNVFPAGTVNELMLTVVHLTAAATSSSDAIVPVHAASARAVMTSTMRDVQEEFMLEGWM
jgi:hypothetical protein